MSVTLTADMRAVIQGAHLCFAATVSPDGTPNVSPERAMRALWRERRTALDREFETYLAQVEPFRGAR